MSDLKRVNWLAEIKSAVDTKTLKAIREQAQKQLSADLALFAAPTVTETLNELHDALIERIVRLAEKELARRGMGSPPVPYAYLLFGSGGRHEQTFASDQDSGIVYANPVSDETGETCRNYFSKLAEVSVSHLIDLGYPPCEGNVVASNPAWCLSLAQWEQKIDLWFAEPSWEHVRYLLILADGRPVAGDMKLAYLMKSRFNGDMVQSPVIVRRMMENTLRHKILVGVFGQLLPERYGENAGSLDIKYGAYIPMVNVFRLMAVRTGIRVTGTSRRIAALQLAGELTEPEAQSARSAFALILKLRLMAGADGEGGRWTGGGKIPVNRLNKDLKRQLKKALKFGRELLRRVEREKQHRFKGS